MVLTPKLGVGKMSGKFSQKIFNFFFQKFMCWFNLPTFQKFKCRKSTDTKKKKKKIGNVKLKI